MKSTFTENKLIDSFAKQLLGHSRHDCTQLLADSGVNSISFAHWLAIPNQQLLLVFRHQQCVAIDYYKIAA
ncbi:hypothetical protein [uncultured Psychrobacter sp.]|uniref:hypothetical protein n=1 Tax=uncultured Psychrobacter sp. TaxID=259303 RepID=UPI003457D78C